MSKLKLNQRGLGAPLIILLLVAVAAVGGAGYYVFQKQKSDTKLSQTPEQKQAEDKCNSLLDDEDLCKLASTYDMNGQMKTTIVSTSPDGQTGTMVMESDGQGNSRFTTTSGGKVVGGFVYFNNTTYTQSPVDGSWTKYAGGDEQNNNPLSDFDSAFDFEENKPEAERTQYKKIGKEACGEHSCFKYQVIDPATPNTELFIWFDDHEYKLRRMTFKDGEQSGTMEFSYEAVTITEPSPVVEAPNYENMSSEQLQQQLEEAMRQYQNTQ